MLEDISNVLSVLKDTPLPTILVVAGIAFLLLALAGQVAGRIEVPPPRQKWAGAVGILFLVAGIGLSMVPPPLPTETARPTVTQTPVPSPPEATPTPSLIPTQTPTPTPEPSPPVFPSSGKIEAVWVDHAVMQNGQEGMLIHVRFTVDNLQGVKSEAIAYFYSAVDGSPLKDFNNYYATPGGDVAVGSDFVPPQAPATYEDFKLFMPYDELHLLEGQHDLRFIIKLFNYANNEFFAESGYYDFWVRCPPYCGAGTNQTSP